MILLPYTYISTVFSGAIIKRVESSSIAKYLSGGLVYWIYTYLTALSYRSPRIKYTISDDTEPQKDGASEKEIGLYSMAMANGRYLGGNMRIAPNANITDGKVNNNLIIDSHCFSYSDV